MSTPVRSPVVLLVQRNDDAEMYAEFLTHAGVTPITASNAVDAFDAARRSDIVVTGIRLSGELTGLDLIARLRADARTRDLPIIVLTALAWRVERERALEAGCDLFLPKPCLPDDLLRQVRLLLASRHHRTRTPSSKASDDEVTERHARAAGKNRG
jgi:two-component system cell cycle response regulator DivK